MEVLLIGNNAQLIRSFHAVGERIYENDLHYIKPIQSDVEAVFNPQKNNSFKKGEAVRFLLLGDDNRTAVGRIAAFYQDKAGKRRGAWGFFECENNVSYAQALIQSAEKWLRKGLCECPSSG